jgi:hypothetical protein
VKPHPTKDINSNHDNSDEKENPKREVAGRSIFFSVFINAFPVLTIVL